MSYRLIHRTGQVGDYRFDAFAFASIAEAEEHASSLKGDYLIEDAAGRPLDYRIR
jgi:hypothetical protein